VEPIGVDAEGFKSVDLNGFSSVEAEGIEGVEIDSTAFKCRSDRGGGMLSGALGDLRMVVLITWDGMNLTGLYTHGVLL
jgi:hypothetical protein